MNRPYDPRDLAEIRVFHRGTFLCRAVAPELAAQTISLKDLQNARARLRRELRAADRAAQPGRGAHPPRARSRPRRRPAHPPHRRGSTAARRTAAGPPPPAALRRTGRLKLYRED